MQFPNSPRTRETERLMLLWRKENPTADTAAYNAEYVRTYESLTGFSDVEDRKHEDWEAQFDTTDRRYAIISSAPRKPKRPRPPKHRAGTRGAFGKPKHLRLR